MQPDLPSKLYGDHTKLYRILMNILTNSVKYTEVGKIILKIDGKVDGSKELLHIMISDTGYGIKEEDYDKIFTKYNRLDDASNNVIEGTGLGLVITKEYVESMGEKIWFESIYGAGTKFFIDIPQGIADSTPISQTNAGTKTDKIDLIDCTNKRALIVDDSKMNNKIIKKIFEEYNFKVDVLNEGLACINKIKFGEEYDLILLDDMLPDISGTEVVEVLKHLKKEFKIPPIIACTANVMNESGEKYIAKGFDEYLPKPIDIKKLDNLIKKYCSNNK